MLKLIEYKHVHPNNVTIQLSHNLLYWAIMSIQHNITSSYISNSKIQGLSEIEPKPYTLLELWTIQTISQLLKATLHFLKFFILLKLTKYIIWKC